MAVTVVVVVLVLVLLLEVDEEVLVLLLGAELECELEPVAECDERLAGAAGAEADEVDVLEPPDVRA